MTEKNQQQSISTRQVRMFLVLFGIVFLWASVYYLRHRQNTDQPNPPLSTTLNQDSDIPIQNDTQQTVQPDTEVSKDDSSGDKQSDTALLTEDDRIPFPDLSLDELLHRADLALESGQLDQPADDNALSWYLAVLARESENESALEGAHMVAIGLAEQIAVAIDVRDVASLKTLSQSMNAASMAEAEFNQLIAQAERIIEAERLYALATEDVAQQRLVQPHGNNALSHLLTAKTTDLDSSRADAALFQLEQNLLEKAVGAARDNDFKQAASWLDWAEQTRNGSSLVVAAKAEIDTYRQIIVNRTESSAQQAMAAGNYVQARELIAQMRSLEAPDNRVSILNEDLARYQIYGPHRPGEVFIDTQDGVSGPEMIVLPVGEFLMGADSNDPEHTSAEEPRHRVVVERAFALSQTEVTVAEFARFIESAGYQTDAEREGYSVIYNEHNGRMVRSKKASWRQNYRGRAATEDSPVVHVSWNDAQAYASWLGRSLGISYRLPTEAEFEYGLRGGSETIYWWGDSVPDVATENLTGSKDKSPQRRSWSVAFDDYQDGFWGPAPTGSLMQNGYGLYDMAGNVQEWVLDCWHDSYVRAPQTSIAWVNAGCKRRVARGGFWGGKPSKNRSSYRVAYVQHQRGSSIGFRVARDMISNHTSQANLGAQYRP